MRGKSVFATMKKGIIFYVIIIGCLLTLFPAVVKAQPPNDTTISDAVEDELLADGAIPVDRINVTTTDGVVTLSGDVDDLLLKERIANIARGVKGVRSVVNEIMVKPPIQVADWEIRDDVKDALKSDPAIKPDAYQINVSVLAGMVDLSGTVRSWLEKDLCGQVAKSIRGVKGVHNELSIEWGEEASDANIKENVEKTLANDAYVDAGQINVTVKNGKVILAGIVGSASEKRWANIDAHAYGAKDVDDSALEVKGWARDRDLKGNKYALKTDKDIEMAVKRSLFNDPRASKFEIVPEVIGNVVTLRGEVDNLMAKRSAGRDARNIAGVRKVVNRIKVRPVNPLSDQQIRDKVQKDLKRNAYVAPYANAITVAVRNGVVDLNGAVNNYFEKAEADNVASKVNGVIVINNRLIVRNGLKPYIYDPYVDERHPYEYKAFPSEYSLEKSDSQIKAGVEKELRQSPFINAEDVTVAVKDGGVTLTGTVNSWPEYNAATKNAYKGGAVFVNNEIEVK